MQEVAEPISKNWQYLLSTNMLAIASNSLSRSNIHEVKMHIGAWLISLLPASKFKILTWHF